MSYLAERRCKDCGNVDIFPLTKMEAAFWLYNTKKIWNTPCKKCSSTNCASTKHPSVRIDQELLDIWGNDPKLYFLSQDETLIISEVNYVPLLLQAIDKGDYLKDKIDVLIEAVCVILYDNSADLEEYSKEERRKMAEISTQLIPELVKRKKRIWEAKNHIWAHVKEVIFPQIGLPIIDNE